MARDEATISPAIALFRFAVIFGGIADRARAGHAAARNAADMAPLSRKFAERAMDVIREFQIRAFRG